MYRPSRSFVKISVLLAALMLVALWLFRIELQLGVSIPVAAVRCYVEIENQSDSELFLSVSHVNDVTFGTYSARQEYGRRVRGWVRRTEKILAPGEKWLACLLSENETTTGMIQVVACTRLREDEEQKIAMCLLPWSAAHFLGRSHVGAPPQFSALKIDDADLGPGNLSEIKKISIEALP
ncbi:MAG: hypothetical protein JNK74_11340 [Candidatus Hydrogenedentes bacterium]|nr:hypothetical protein [Candidatus Hydrogenedentota bacterium]